MCDLILFAWVGSDFKIGTYVRRRSRSFPSAVMHESRPQAALCGTWQWLSKRPRRARPLAQGAEVAPADAPWLAATQVASVVSLSARIRLSWPDWESSVARTRRQLLPQMCEHRCALISNRPGADAP